MFGRTQVQQGVEERLRIVDALRQRHFLGEIVAGRAEVPLRLRMVALVFQHKAQQEAVVERPGDLIGCLEMGCCAVVPLIGQHLADGTQQQRLTILPPQRARQVEGLLIVLQGLG
ncbi:MAG: hypothetical protein KatS3mg051_0410 [Anaerolineae bacterium]|nr:MAG: hypothetical protein KatS3mg051_0410 [Anaerolineae bacterium]